MREDMHELLVERPRWAHRARYPRAFVRNHSGVRNRTDVLRDDLPTREALSRSRYGDKHLSENFAPLRRFLRSNVGRPWSLVHSEMAKVLAPSNAVQRHVLDHLPDFLATNVYESDGTLWAARSSWGGPSPLRATTRSDSFYVHPRTKLLCVLPQARRKRTRGPCPPNPHVRELSPTKQLRRLGGIWYELTVTPFPPAFPREKCIDVIAKRPVRWDTYSLHPELVDLWESGRYTIARRQVSKRELRDLL